MLNSPKKGFTLIELLLFLSIIVVMISIVVFVARPKQILQNTKQIQIENDKQSIQTAYTKYKVDNNGQALFGDNLIPGMLYKICKDTVEDCDIDNYEVSISSLKDNRLLKNIPEIPDNSDSRYTGYYLSEIDGADVNILVNTEIQNIPENTPPGSCFAYQGKTYCVVEGGGGELWLDRNLGGDNAGGSETDAGAYGELYQFGRGKDGHEIRTSGVSAGPSSSTSPGSNYLSIGGSPYNWYNGAIGDSLWQGESGINNPCPNTWRLPSEEEWSDEISSWSSQNSAGGYGSSLKLVKGGRRDSSGSVQEAGSAGYYWSYSVENGTDKAKRVRIDNGSVVWNVGDERAEGMAVRCIKDKNAVGEQNNPSNYTLTEDGLGRCTGTLNINGSYRQGMELTGAETVELSVFVASVGSYTISTDIINGYRFTKTGTFNSTGNTTVVLVNDGGIPENPGTDRFIVSGSNTDCTFEVNVSEGTFYCPENYVRVPGNSVYGVSNYCLMKYEAKNVGGVPTSQAAGLPWTNISQTDAISECSSLGTGYQLVTNEQWMTMARNMEQVSTNWNGGTVGSSYLNYGHSDSNPNNALAASTLDTDTYSGTGNSTPSGQKRTLSLSNTEVIWDIAGNVAEWINGSITCAGVACTSAEMPYDSTPSAEWAEFTSVATYGELSYKLLRPLNYLLNSANGMGKLYTDNDAANPSGNSHALIRGGGWDYAANSGIYSLRLDYSPAYTASNLGFRCASSALVNPVCVSIAVPNTPSGPNDLYHATSGHVYIVNSIPNVDIYEWVYSGTGATITSGAQTNSITVSYANGATSGSWKVRAINSDTPINCEPQFESEYSSNLAVTITIPPTTVVANTATATYSVSSQNVTLNASLTNLIGAVNAGTVTFQLKNSGGTNVGTAVTSGTVTNGTVSVTYSIPAGTSSGAYNVHATYNPSGIFGAGSDTDSFLELTINPLNPTLSVSNTSKTFDDIAFTIAYSEDSDGTVTFTSSNTGVATITNAGLVSIAGAGTSTITLSTSATTNFNAGSTTATLSVNKANQLALSITMTSGTYGSTLTLATLGGSGIGAVTYAVTTAGTASCSVSGSTLSFTSAGTCTVTATKAADTNYNAVSSSATTITINKANQAALTITPIKGHYGTNLTLATSGGNGTGAVTYVVTTAGTASCSVSGSTLSFTSNGNCTVTATKATDTNYNAVSSSATTITIGNKPLSVSLSTPSKVYDGNTTATVTPTLVGGIVGSDVVTITTTGVSWAYDTATAGTGKTVTRTGSYALGGTNAGKYTLTQPSTTVTGSITKANQAALTLTPITAHMFNTSRVYTAGGGSGTGTYSDSLVSGSATRTAAFTYTANSGTGTYVIRVTRATDANFNSATQDFTFPLAKANQSVLSINSRLAIQNKSLTLSTTGGSGSGSISYSNNAAIGGCSVSSNTLSNTRAGICQVTATKASDANFNVISSSQTDIKIEGLVAWWRMNGSCCMSAIDSSGNGNTGTAVNGAAVNNNSGINDTLEGGYTNFDGINDSISVPDNNTLDAGTSNMTISGWIFPLSSQNFDMIVRKNNMWDSQDGYLFSYHANGVVVFSIGDGTNAFQIITAQNVAPINQWSHVAVVINRFDNALSNIFVNGQVVTQTKYYSISNIADASDTNILEIGKGWSSDYFHGRLDDIRIYNRALSTSELQNIYLSAGLRTYLKMDEASWNGATNQVVDSSGNNNHATSLGSATISTGRFGNSGVFDIANKSVRISDIQLSNIHYTIAAWIRLPLATTGTFRTLTRGTTIDHQILVETSGILGSYNNTNSQWLSSGYNISSSLAAGWHHIIAVGNETTNQTQFYINGGATPVGTVNFKSDGQVSFIGNCGVTCNQNWGQVDEFRVYDRILTSHERTALFNFAPPPIVNWRFDETGGVMANDVSDGGYSLQFGANTAMPTFQSGRYGNALSFDGNDTSSVTIPRPSQPLTLEFWTRTSNGSPVGIFDSAPAQGDVIRNWQSGSVEWWEFAPTLSLGLSSNTWQHVALVYQHTGSSRQILYYRNGVLISQPTAVGSSTFAWTTFNVGSINNGGGGFYNGMIDEFRIYNYARSASQITQDFNNL